MRSDRPHSGIAGRYNHVGEINPGVSIANLAPQSVKRMNRIFDSFALQRVTGRSRALLLIALAILYVIARWPMSAANQVFHNELLPLGIISFELAWDPAIAQLMLDNWNAAQTAAVLRHTTFDFLYLLAYGGLVSLLVENVARGFTHEMVVKAGAMLSWCAVLAAALDAIENLGILVMLDEGAASPWPQLVALFAGLKFMLIIPGLLYLLLMAPFSIGRYFARRRS